MKTLILGISIAFLAASCSSENQTEGEKALEQDLKETIGNSIKTAEEFKGKLDELLTLPMAASVSGLSESSAKKDYTKMSTFESLVYEWPSDRTKEVKIASTTMEVPVKNSIQLSWVKNTTLEQFKRDYHNPTPEEIKRAKEAMNDKMSDMKSKGEVSTDQANTASSEANKSISQFSVSEVPNLGDYALFVNTGVFGAKIRDLKVFYKGLSFTITADLSDEAAYNDKKCIETARKIINEKLQ
jgi:hypothetical protein